ncbi:MAG TPA: DUF1302 family protein [Polyangiaceae bacterium]
MSGFALLPSPALAQPAEEPPAADAADQPAAQPADAPAADAPPAESPPDAAEPAVEGDAAAVDSNVVVEGGSLFEDGGASTADAGDAISAASAPALPFELNGYVRGDAFFGKETRGKDAILRAGYGELALQFRTQRQEYGDAFAEARFRYGQQGETQDLIVDLREAYANVYAGPFDLRLGKQIIVWGKADGFNPTNNITPVDLTVRSPLEDDRRVGNFGARAFLNFAPVRLEGVWMPLYIPTKFPPIPLEPGVTLLDPVIPGPELENGLGAGRLHLELSSFEMSASYLYGNALLPGLERYAYDVGSNASVVVQRRVYTHQVIGFDFSTAFGEELGLRGEAAYRAPINEEAIYTPNREVNYVVGLDRTFGSLSVIAQYIGKYVLDWEREGTDNPAGLDELREIPPADLMTPSIVEDIEAGIDEEMRRRNQILFQQTEELQHTASVRLEYLALHDTLSFSVLGAYNFSTAEWLAFPKISYKFSDALSGSIGGELYNGPEDTLLDYLDQDLTAGYVELKYAF